MKTLFASFLLLLAGIFVAAQAQIGPIPGMPPPFIPVAPLNYSARVGTNTSTGTISSLAITTTAPVSGLLAACVNIMDGGSIKTISGISDSVNAWVKAKASSNSSNASDTEIWYYYYTGTLASGSTITATFSSSLSNGTNSGAQGILFSFVGAIPSPLDKTASSTFSNSSTVSVSTGTMSVQPEVIVGCAGGAAPNNSAVTWTESANFTGGTTESQGGGYGGTARMSYLKVTATTSVTYAPNPNQNSYGSALVATFE